MTKKETKGRSVVSSIIVLMLCFAMLLGTTYAWFTDSKSTAINKVKSGTLKVDIVDAYNTSLVGKTLGFIAADGREQDAILWEPGCTYKVQDFYILNTGKLALKYKVYVNGIDGDNKLLEVIKWTNKQGEEPLAEFEGYLEPGARSAAPISIIGHMLEEAGNEYQDLECEGIGVTVVATQWTYEKDSIDEKYDKNAEYSVARFEDFMKAIDSMNEGETTTINLTQDLDLTGLPEDPENNMHEGYGIEVPIGSTLIINGCTGTDGNGNPILSEIKVDHTAFNNGVGNEGLSGNTNVQFKNVKFVAKNAGQGYAVCTGFDFTGKVEFDNCEFKNLYTAVLENENQTDTLSTLIIKDCRYDNTTWGYSIDTATSGKSIADQANVTFTGNTGLAAGHEFETWG